LEPLSYVISIGRVFCPDRIAHLPSNPWNVSKAVSELPIAVETASIRKSRNLILRKIILKLLLQNLSRNLLSVSSGSGNLEHFRRNGTSVKEKAPFLRAPFVGLDFLI